MRSQVGKRVVPRFREVDLGIFSKLSLDNCAKSHHTAFTQMTSTTSPS